MPSSISSNNAHVNNDDGDDSNNIASNTSFSHTAATVNLPNCVVVHPLVLLATVDHYNRVAKDTSKRVCGILLGTTFKGKIDVTNTYAVPFEEDPKDPNVWFLDHNFHENMYAMFRKVNAKEKVVGWYSTGPKIRPADLEIHEMLRKYHSNLILVIIDVNPQDELTIPTKAYCSIESSPEERSTGRNTFIHIPSEIGALEAEEVGVEHLLRDIRDSTVSTLAKRVEHKNNSLKGFKKHMLEMSAYLSAVAKGSLPPNYQILYQIQDIFNLSPNLQVDELVKAFSVKTNDQLLIVYLSSMIRGIIALHNLINNKLENKRERENIMSANSKEKTKTETTVKKVGGDKAINSVKGDKKSAQDKGADKQDSASDSKAKKDSSSKK